MTQPSTTINYASPLTPPRRLPWLTAQHIPILATLAVFLLLYAANVDRRYEPMAIAIMASPITSGGSASRR